MRHLSRTLLLLACSLAPAVAQWSTAPADSARRDFRQRLLQALDLTADQRDSLRVRRDELRLGLQDLRQQVDAGQLLAYEGRLQYRALLAAYRAARDSILTSRQLQLLRRARDWEREQALTDGRGPDDGPQRLAEALALTADQRRRWRSLLTRQRGQVQQLQESGQTLTSTDLQRLREQYRLSFEAILTPEQRLELERYRLRRGDRAAEAEAQLDAGYDLLDPEPAESFRDNWESVESDLGEDGAEP